MASEQLTQGGKTDYLFVGDGCCQVTTFFVPENFAECMGQNSKSYTCCVEDNSAGCIFHNHSRFDELVQGEKEDVCCICMTGEMSFVKPLCLTGEKACIKKTSSGCCVSSRCSMPEDKDTPRVCASYGIKCCETAPFACTPACCEPIAPLPAESMPDATECEEAQMSAEYVLCAYGFGMCTMYVPHSRTDAFGVQQETLICCCKTDLRNFMLPKDQTGNEILVIQGGQIQCIKPPCFKGGPVYKGVVRIFCSTIKFAFPCDNEVPFAISCGSTKCVEKPPHGKFQCCVNPKLDPSIGRVPMFPALQAPSKPSMKIVNGPGAENMERA